MFRWNAKSRITVAIVLTLLAVIYLAVIPTVIAWQYLKKFDKDAITVNTSLKSLSKSTMLPVFNNPDISLVERQQQLDGAMVEVAQTQNVLKKFSQTSRLRALPGTGFAGEYHKASIEQERAQDIVHQSGQVLDEYRQTLQYLSAHNRLYINLDQRLNEINAVNDFDPLKNGRSRISAMAAETSQDEQALQSLKPPPGFAALQDEAVQTFSRAATGLQNLAAGLNQSSDPQIYQAVAQLEDLTLKSQVNDKELLVDLTDRVPILREIAELPEKMELFLEK